jgi:NMD protein affecting ribosome stability and mRNA decay
MKNIFERKAIQIKASQQVCIECGYPTDNEYAFYIDDLGPLCYACYIKLVSRDKE